MCIRLCGQMGVCGYVVVWSNGLCGRICIEICGQECLWPGVCVTDVCELWGWDCVHVSCDG